MRLNWKSSLLGAVLIGIISFGILACEQNGPAEKVGEKIDEAVEEAGDKIQEGPAERAGEKIDEAVEEAGEAVEEAGDEIREKTN